MKKMFKSLIVSLVMVCAMTATIFANPVTDLRDQLLSVGVSSSDAAKVVEYLQKTTISDAQYKTAMDKVEQAKAIIGNTTDISKLSASNKSQLQSLAGQAGNALGLKVNFGKNAQGITTVVVNDSKGGTLLSMSTADVMGTVTNFNISTIVGVLEEMVEFSNSPNKGDFTPVGGELTDTATGYGNVMAIGLAMIAGAAAMVFVSKKQFA